MEQSNLQAKWLAQAQHNLHQELLNNKAVVTSTTPILEPPSQLCPRVLVYNQPGFMLFRYQPSNTKFRGRIVITFALINRPYIVDMPQRSLVQKLLAQGFEVFLLEWTEPHLLESPPTWTDYAINFPSQALVFIQQNYLNTKTILFGICQGAILSLICSLAATVQIDGLVLSGIPFAYGRSEHQFKHLVKWLDLDNINSPIWPGVGLDWIFKSLNPISLHYGKLLKFINKDPNSLAYQDFQRVETWVHDIPPISGPAFKQFLRDFVQENKCMQGNYYLDEKVIDPKNINCPVLNIVADQDTIVPPVASLALAEAIPVKYYHELILNGGHLSPYISHSAQTQLITKLKLWWGFLL